MNTYVNNYTSPDLTFNYLNLKKYLYNIYIKGIDDINIFLLISLEKEYYEGDNLKKIIKDLVKLSNNLIMNFEILDDNGNPTGKKTEKIKFKVNKIQFQMGDVLNRHRWVYRNFEKYLLEKNLNNENEIPENIKKELIEKSYNQGKQQGKDWFKEHAIPALNEVLSYGHNNLLDSSLRWNDVPTNEQRNIIPEDMQIQNKQRNVIPAEAGIQSLNETLIPQDFQLTDGITTIFEGNDNIPKIEYICYDYWLNHPKYKIVENALHKLISLPNSIIDRTYNFEVEYYMERLEKRGEEPKFPEMFFKYSREYIVDETMPSALIHQDICNNFEFYYYGGESMYSRVYDSKNAKKNTEIQECINNELCGLNSRNYVSFRIKND